MLHTLLCHIKLILECIGTVLQSVKYLLNCTNIKKKSLVDPKSNIKNDSP